MNSTKSKLNVKLLRRVKRHILADPRRLVMQRLVEKKQGDDNIFIGDAGHQEFPPCGTAACIAGWTLILSGKEPFKIVGRSTNDATTAARLLNIRHWQPLFYSFLWPLKFAIPYRQADTPAKRAKIAAERIEYLITKGE